MVKILVMSNLNYLFFGFFFLFYVQNQDKVQTFKKDVLKSDKNLFLAIGVSIIFTGVFSGIYHICPTSSSFQFGMF